MMSNISRRVARLAQSLRRHPASANNFIGTGGSGGLVSGVNGNVVL
jgi:hypothetical protein